MERVLVIGGTRGTGLLIVRRLLEEGYRVRVLARNGAQAREKLGPSVEVVEGDITKPETLTGVWGEGVDHIVEVGGAGTLAESMRAVRAGGTIHLIGVLASGEAPLSIVPVFMSQLRVQGVLVGPREAFEQLVRAFALHEVRPVVDRVFPFEETPAAFARLAAGAHFGKICLRVG